MYNFENAPYRVRYAEIPARQVLNFLEPSKTNIDHLNARNDFYNRMEDSIIKEGVRNPVMLWSVAEDKQKEKELFRIYKTPGRDHQFQKIRIPEFYKDKDYILVCRTHGGSRLFISQKHDLIVPCIISDFCGRYEDYGELLSKEEIMAKFKDKPASIELARMGVIVLRLPNKF